MNRAKRSENSLSIQECHSFNQIGNIEFKTQEVKILA